MMNGTPINFDSMKPEEFENYLPDLFAKGNGKVSQDPDLQKFLSANPDCAALVRDLETIAETARSLFATEGPSDEVWDRLQNKLHEEAAFEPQDDLDGLKEID